MHLRAWRCAAAHGVIHFGAGRRAGAGRAPRNRLGCAARRLGQGAALTPTRCWRRWTFAPPCRRHSAAGRGPGAVVREARSRAAGAADAGALRWRRPSRFAAGRGPGCRACACARRGRRSKADPPLRRRRRGPPPRPAPPEAAALRHRAAAAGAAARAHAARAGGGVCCRSKRWATTTTCRRRRLGRLAGRADLRVAAVRAELARWRHASSPPRRR